MLLLIQLMKGFPLNVMYWAKNDDGIFEILDGQQRTISFCQYVAVDFSVNNRTFNNLTATDSWLPLYDIFL